MTETHEFLMPDYYPAFQCKMGACRRACCEGWPVSVTMENYFRLLGVSCAPDLRRRLDTALHLAPHPDTERYAVISPRWDGNCPLRAEDGRCALQLELGEEALADVCRLYPRGVRSENGAYECSCSCSCEGVLELLLRRPGPIRFLRKTLTTLVPGSAERHIFFDTFGHESELRQLYADILQDDSHPLSERLSVLGEVLSRTEQALAAHSADAVERLLSAPLPAPLFLPADVTEDQLLFGLSAAEGMLGLLDEKSESIRSFGEQALSYFRAASDPLEAYRAADAHFSALLPNWEEFFSKMLVNHNFFVRFPFQDRPEGMIDEFCALCCIYGLLRFLSLGVMAEEDDLSRAIDVCAAAFRLIDHTDFDRNALYLLHRHDCVTQERLTDLISL